MDKHDKFSNMWSTLPYGVSKTESLRGTQRSVDECFSKLMVSRRSDRGNSHMELGEDVAISKLWLEFSNLDRDINS